MQMTIYSFCRSIAPTVAACFFLHLPSKAQINRAEPLNWFTGMKNPRLQLMVEGPGIGSAQPSLVYPGVRIEKVIPADSKNYLFIDLYIQPGTKPGTERIPIYRCRLPDHARSLCQWRPFQ
jgi:hypothetical protein